MRDCRTFVQTVMLYSLAAPLTAEAQQAGKVPRIGFLGPTASTGEGEGQELSQGRCARSEAVCWLMAPPIERDCETRSQRGPDAARAFEDRRSCCRR